MKRIALVAAMLITSSIARAQSIPKDFVYDVKHGVLDILSVWASPFHGSLRTYEIGTASLGASALMATQDDNLAAWVRGHPDAGVLRTLTPFREGDPWSLVNIGSGDWHPKGALAVYGIGLVTRNRAIRDLGMGCLAAHEAHTVLRSGVYAAVSRERPLFRETIDGVEVDRPGHPYDVTYPGTENWYDNSFFAGHVASVTSCVSFINARFHLGYAEPALWAVGAALSLGRIADQRHYASDVLLGGLIGFGAGKLVGDRSRKRAEQRASGKPNGAAAGAGDRRSWMDGVYVSRAGTATVIGWRTQR